MMQKEFIFSGTLLQYWGIVFSFWESALSGDRFGQEPFKIPPKALADSVPTNQTRLVIWWENDLGIHTGQAVAISLPDGKTKLSIQIDDDSETALHGWKRLAEELHEYLIPVPQSAPIDQEKPEKKETPKQKGRYRLTPDEIRRRKKIVKDANRIFKESNPEKTWKQIAHELEIPERTLRDWRHNPQYS